MMRATQTSGGDERVSGGSPEQNSIPSQFDIRVGMEREKKETDLFYL